MNKKVILISAAIIIILLIWGIFAFLSTPKETPPEEILPTDSSLPSVIAPTKPPADTAELEKQITGAAEEGLDIFMLASNLKFGPPYVEVKQGKTLKAQIVSDGAHTFTIDELGVDQPLVAGKNNFTFTANKTGTFEIYCKVPGHKEAGMTAELFIQE